MKTTPRPRSRKRRIAASTLALSSTASAAVGSSSSRSRASAHEPSLELRGPEQDVLGNGHRRKALELLVHDRDAASASGPGAVEDGRAAIEDELAFVGP